MVLEQPGISALHTKQIPHVAFFKLIAPSPCRCLPYSCAIAPDKSEWRHLMLPSPTNPFFSIIGELQQGHCFPGLK